MGPLVQNGLILINPVTEKCNVQCLSYLISLMVSQVIRTSKLSLRLTELIFWIRLFFDRAVSIEKLSSLFLTKKHELGSWRSTAVKWRSDQMSILLSWLAQQM